MKNFVGKTSNSDVEELRLRTVFSRVSELMELKWDRVVASSLLVGISARIATYGLEIIWFLMFLNEKCCKFIKFFNREKFGYKLRRGVG